MKIGELALATDVSKSTIENYYIRGIISADSNNGRREFPEGTERIVMLVNDLASFGFTLEDLKFLFKRGSIEEIDERAKQLRDFRSWVQQIIG